MHDYWSVLRINDPDLKQIGGSVRANEHRKTLVQRFNPYGLTQCVPNVLVVDPVSVSTLRYIGLTGHT